MTRRSLVLVKGELQMKYSMLFGCLTAAFTVTAAAADDAGSIKTVFVIALETTTGRSRPARLPPNFPEPQRPVHQQPGERNGHCHGQGRQVNISRQTAYATNYLNVISVPDGNGPHVHPCEPNYLWAEAGSNFLVSNDADPYGPNGSATNQVNDQDGVLHLTTLLTVAGRTWRSYRKTST
jgi:phosphatidylinositol-3-phosphatase